MKFLNSIFRHALLACVISLSPAFLLAARAQSKPATNQAQTASASQTADPLLARQKREQAYAKLLEGQRLLQGVRGGGAGTAAMLRQAQQAFQEAGQLDPTLAEAYTALAEISLFFAPQDIDEAQRQANIAVGINRNNFGAHQLLSRIYGLKSGLNSKELDKPFVQRTVTELLEVTRLAPNDAEAWALLGELYLALGRTDEAINALTRWSSLPPAFNSIFYQTIVGNRNWELSPDLAAARLAEALLRAGRPREAFAAIRRALAINPQSGEYEELLSRAIEANAPDDAAVLADLRGMVMADQQNVTAAILLARVLVRAGRLDESIKTLRAAIDRHAPSDKDGNLALRLSLGQTLADAERYQDAISVYEDILKEHSAGAGSPQSPSRSIATEMLRRIADLHKSAGQPDQALATVERMRTLLGKDSTSDLEQIRLLREMGKQREALQAVRTARQRSPATDDFVYLEAELLGELGQVEEGVKLLHDRLMEFRKPTSEPDKDYELYLRISYLYVKAGRGTEAVAAARKAVERAPADRPDMMSGALIMLSSAQERAGDVKGSEESLRSVLAKDPDNATALNNLGYFLVERNERLNEALEMIQRAIKSDPTNTSFLDSLGWAYFKLGQLEQAELHLTKAARLNASSATIQEHLGDLYQRQGKKEQARTAWQKALKLLAEGEQAARIKAKLAETRP